MSFLLIPGIPVLGQNPFDFNLDTPYGNNKAVGKYVTVNGIRMYYEEYGSGEPMLLIHGNGGSIHHMAFQIEHFRKSYRVIVADSRGHGKSELNTDSLTYVQMAEDWAALTNQLRLDSVYIIGWSDGGIIGLLLAIEHPDIVKKLAAMGANLRPDSTAVYPWAVHWVIEMRKSIETMVREKDTSQNWSLVQQLFDLLGDQPTISTQALHEIKAPVLVLAGDKDVIREEHSIEIYQNIRKAHLCIFPGETHMIPVTDPELFNRTIEKFFRQPFVRPDTRTYMQ